MVTASAIAVPTSVTKTLTMIARPIRPPLNNVWYAFSVGCDGHSTYPPASMMSRSLASDVEITTRIGRPFWLDTVGNSNIIEIRIQLQNKVLRVFARRSQAYASNTHIFLLWMVGTSLVLLMIAIPFLLFDGVLFGLIDTGRWGQWLIWASAILTVWSMVYYLQKALPEIRKRVN